MVTSEKLLRALQSKSPFGEEEIAKMSGAAGWDWIYGNAGPQADSRAEVCLTGFSAAEASALVGQIEATSWLRLVTSVTAKLSYLCAGANAGPAEIEKARRQGALLVSADNLLHMIAARNLAE